ncbi:unnamed protein product [Thlaspi arvense]|uniref:Zinc finger PHD-type domain-containing protein n=1 Tax=Thlaspi arvense TaxID=13288 RepID=A0AAU9T4R0_THLAR|nr:unnamed protein product [Thlaspi arvense]
MISMIGTCYYICATCDRKFHKECIECPLEIQHPSYPFLSLKLHHFYPSDDESVNKWQCFCCQETILQQLYYCPTNKLIMDPVCAMKPIPIFIDHPKRHLHTLTIFPKQNFLPCGVCGLIREHSPTYIISRHHHRISTSSLPSGKWSCGVCRRKVDNNYGAYSCNKCDDYFVHTKCALQEDLWDGKELEGTPEEPEIVVEPFERISDGIILHFAHGHHMRLQISGAYNEGKFCQACSLPIYEGSYYSCMRRRCDFILHEACANAPRKKHHALHARPLTLKVGDIGYFFCSACKRQSCGFVYEDPEINWGFKLDLQCASISEPFQYESHKHPLFLALTPEEEKSAICQVCQEEGDEYNEWGKLTCIECNYIICFRCATLPYKARYKHDKHFLIFRKKEEGNDEQGWCDICESKIVYSRKGGFYSCDGYCSTTVHVDCLLGNDPYMKPGQFNYWGRDVLILHNKTMSRPFCHGKEHCCEDKIIECNYIICFTCATLPYKARYKHDKHFLIFRKKKAGNDEQGWCDTCESKIVYSRKGGFYSCDDYCSTTVHVHCLLGNHPYLKPGQITYLLGREVRILHNNTVSRPFCYGTEHRCEDKVVFKLSNMTLCYFDCLKGHCYYS